MPCGILFIMYNFYLTAFVPGGSHSKLATKFNKHLVHFEIELYCLLLKKSQAGCSSTISVFAIYVKLSCFACLSYLCLMFIIPVASIPEGAGMWVEGMAQI